MDEQAVEKEKSFPMSDEQRLKIVGNEANLLLLQRKYQQLLQLGERFTDDLFAAVPGSLAMKYFAIGIAQKGLGDEAAARTAFLKAKDILEEQLKQKPDDADLHVQLAKMLAWLGEKDTAIAEAQRAMDLRPESKDAFEGPPITEQVAQVYAILGDNARAIELLDGLLSRPSEVTLHALKLTRRGIRSGTMPGSRRCSPNTRVKLNYSAHSRGISLRFRRAILLSIAFCSCWLRLPLRRRQSGKSFQPKRNLAAQELTIGMWLWKTPPPASASLSMLQFSR